MKFLVWCGCVTVSLSGLELSLCAHDGWRWLWYPVLVFYGFAGVVLAGISLAKLVAGKVGAGGLSRLTASGRAASAPHKEE